ncbi:MAG: lysophospholipid acyltransferase family protein [Pseudomonadota bacterium]
MKSYVFALMIYGIMGVMGVFGAPIVLWREDWTRAWQKTWCRIVFALLRRGFGIDLSIEGPVPEGDILIAAKHQSMLDVLILYEALPRARFVMKRELMWMPVFGLYAKRTGAVPIDRTPRYGAAEAVVTAFQDAPGQIVVYPQGTRVAPGETAPYRRGIARLAEATGRQVIPAATNAGLFWRKGGRICGPGTVTLRFGAPIIAEGRAAQMSEIEAWIEAESTALASKRL